MGSETSSSDKEDTSKLTEREEGSLETPRPEYKGLGQPGDAISKGLAFRGDYPIP